MSKKEYVALRRVERELRMIAWELSAPRVKRSLQWAAREIDHLLCMTEEAANRRQKGKSKHGIFPVNPQGRE